MAKKQAKKKPFKHGPYFCTNSLKLIGALLFINIILLCVLIFQKLSSENFGSWNQPYATNLMTQGQ